MTTPQYCENLLRDKWTSSISGRPHDVGDIYGEGGDDTIRIVYESDKDWRRMDLANYDYITIMDGGDVEISPQSFGWQEEQVVSRVDLDIRTKGWPSEDREGRISLYGERGAGSLNNNESPRWGGLTGEAQRVMKTVRNRDKEFDVINVDIVDDISSQMGGQIWRAIVQCRFEQRANQIDTST